MTASVPPLTTVTTPCSADPDLWFGYADDEEIDGTAKARLYERSATQARLLCLRRCPLSQQRRCAGYAVEHGEEYGVWAGIKLPGGQYRKRGELARAHQTLRRIAAGEINARELAENAALLAGHEHDASAAPATVFTLAASRHDPESAA
ncbi:transcriptional regulator [Mycolicibacillus koreensis]|nr:transcriptional regulator [Mycolicibacillus koreensis]